MSDPPPDRLARRLRTPDAVVIGLGSMIGAGIFTALAPAAAVAGSGLLVGLAVAAAVAYANATSSAQLAAIHPESGGTYVYGRERLGDLWGFLAGWGFVVGKTASCAAMALTFGAYVWPGGARPLAVAAVVALAAVNYRGVRKTANLTRAIVAVVLLTLALVVVACLGGGTTSRVWFMHLGGEGLYAILQSAGLFFFAFAGYARVATLGEEVVEPERTIPRAIPLALGITLLVYAVVAVSALFAVGPNFLAATDRPLAVAVQMGDLRALVPAVRIGAAVASAGVLLSLLAGVSRTVFAMSRNGELVGWLDAVHPRHRVPHRAELAVAAVVAVVAATLDVREAIGFSSFTVLVYYAITNASAWTLPAGQRRWPRPVAGLGLVGCLTLAATLPWTSVAAGTGVLGVGIAIRQLRR